MSTAVLRRAHLTLFGSALGGVLAIANEVLCARYLGVNAYGLYALAVILARVSESVSILGLPVATLHYVSIYRDRGQWGEVLGTILASLCSPLLVGSLLATTLWLLAPVLARDLFDNAASASYIRAIAIAIPFMGLSEVLAVITRGFGKAGYYVLVRNIVPPVVFMLLLLAVTRRGFEAVWVARAFALAYAVAAATGFAAVFWVCGADLFRRKARLPFRSLYTYSLPVLFNTLLYLVVACTSILLLGVLVGDREVGIFRACMQLVIPFDMVVIAFNAAVGHLYPVLESNNRRDELSMLVQKITRWMSALALAMLLIFAFNRHDLMGLMGRGFADGADTLLMLAVGHAMLCSIGSAGYLLVMSARQRYETFNAAAAALACVALNWVLIPAYGTFGAALATTLACLVVSVLRVVQVKRLTGISVLRGSFVRIIVTAAATAAVLWAAERLLGLEEGRGPVVLGLRMTLIVAVFGFLYWFVALDRQERRGFQASLRDYFSRAPDNV